MQPPFLLRYLLNLDSLLRLEVLYFRRKIQLIFPGSVCAQILCKFQGCIRNFSIFPFHTFFFFSRLLSKPGQRHAAAIIFPGIKFRIKFKIKLPSLSLHLLPFPFRKGKPLLPSPFFLPLPLPRKGV